MIRKITIEDAGYPENLKNIPSPPQALYVNGTILGSDKIAVALVGSRRATPYGLQTCERLAYELAVRGVTVVSGMARGIDSAAHRGAIRAGGRTIAVMGSGHNDIYPPENKGLYKEIASSGAVVTEYEDDKPPLAENFPRRNRIISGLSLGVVVVEAARNSGALITASFAAEQGRDVLAVPGKVSSTTSAGTNELIKDGARLVQSADDIMEELSLSEVTPPGLEKMKDQSKRASMTKAYIYNSLNEDERRLYKELSDEPLYIDELLEKCGMTPSRGSKALLSLELKRLIEQLPGKQFIKKGS